MNREDRQKTGKARRHEAPDARLDREMHDVYIALKANNGDGPYGSRRIANAAHGITQPHRSLGNLLRDAKRAKCKSELAEKIGWILIEHARRTA